MRGVLYLKQGMRPYMEDRHLVAGDLHAQPDICLYSVFDGHGGAQAAQFCIDNFASTIKEVISGPQVDVNNSSSIGDVMKRVFEKIDLQFLFMANRYRPPLDDGTTAIAALTVNSSIYVANAGDSRAVLVRAASVVPLSVDHKPNLASEMARIQQKGGRVLFHGVWRVEGILAVSRAIGDRILKRWVTSEPEVSRFRVGGGDRWLVLATDGLWDVMNSEELSEVLRGCATAEHATDILLSLAFARRSTDNVTVMVVDLRKPRPTAEILKNTHALLGNWGMGGLEGAKQAGALLGAAAPKGDAEMGSRGASLFDDEPFESESDLTPHPATDAIGSDLALEREPMVAGGQRHRQRSRRGDLAGGVAEEGGAKRAVEAPGGGGGADSLGMGMGMGMGKASSPGGGSVEAEVMGVGLDSPDGLFDSGVTITSQSIKTD